MLLYIHIPFCQSKCPYCAFGSHTDKNSLIKPYFKAISKDLEFQISKFKNLKITSVFIGGGTPSAVNCELYEPLFEIFRPFLSKNAEITSEANPNSANFKWLSGMKNLGVNRISFGIQSFFEDKLRLLGRTHSSKDAKDAVLNAKKAGFKNINADLIYATKLDNKKRLKLEVEKLLELKVTHASAYALTLEENTPFENRIELKKDSATLAKFIISELENSGFKQYEISNFGKICKHNLGYWKGYEYIGVGAYSVGFYDKSRLYATKDIKEYIKNPNLRKIENLSNDDIRLESIFLGLRSKIGIKKNKLKKVELERAMFLLNSGKLYFKDSKFFAKNLLLADELALYIAD